MQNIAEQYCRYSSAVLPALHLTWMQKHFAFTAPALPYMDFIGSQIKAANRSREAKKHSAVVDPPTSVNVYLRQASTWLKNHRIKWRVEMSQLTNEKWGCFPD